jgi:hypothetical protein
MVFVMRHQPVQIRNDEVVRDIRELAELTGKPITDAVAAAVRSELVRARRRAASSPDQRRRAVEDAVRRFEQAPTIGPMLSDDDLYDEFGLPR